MLSSTCSLILFFDVVISLLQHITYRSSGSSSNNIEGDKERDFFVELWDISGHERYKDCRSLFYSQINGKQWVSSSSENPYHVLGNDWHEWM